MKLTCIIVTKDRAVDLQRCLTSLHQQQEPADEVIVVDGGNSVEPMVREFGYTYYSSQPGITRQRNLARQHVTADTDIVIYCDDDTTLPANCFQLVRDQFKIYLNVIGLTGSVDHQTTHGLLKKILGYLTLTYTSQPFGFTAGVFNIINPLRQAQAVHWLPGAFMAYRWAAVKDLAFDEWFADYGLGEDFDFSYRVSKLGQLWAEPALKIDHHHSDVNRNWKKFGYMRIQNRQYLRRKYWPKQPKYWLGMWWANLWLLAFNGLRGLSSRRYGQEWIGEWQALFTRNTQK